MADTQSAKYNLGLTVEETKEQSLDNVANPTMTHTLGSHTGTLTATTSPPVTKTYSDDIPLVAGTYTIDLQALPGPASSTIDLTGLKIQLVKITCPVTNGSEMTFDVGASNGYNLFGATSATDESVAVQPGGVCMMQYTDDLEDVANADSEVDVTGSGTESFSIILVAG